MSRGPNRGALAVLFGLVAAATGCLTPLAAADPTPSPTDPALQLGVELGSLTPYAPQPGRNLRLAGVLRNSSAGAVSGLGVQLLLSHSKLGSRGEFDDYAGTPDGPAPDDATAVTAAEVRLPRTELAAGAAQRFVIKVPVDALQPLESWQVYELAVAVTGIPETSPTGTAETVGRLRTFLPYAPVDATGTGLPMQVAWLWPLADRPHRTDDATWTDDDLAPELAADGRLGSLIQAARAAADQQRPPPPERSKRWERRHRDDPPKPPKPPKQPVPVTWVLDPALVDDVTTMADGYKLGTGEDAPEGIGEEAAGSWLDELRAAVAGSVVLPLPYADPDVTAAVRSQLTHEVQVALTNDRSSGLIDGLDPAQTLGYAWPPDGLPDQRAIDALFVTGISTVILDSTALPYLDGTPAETPGARTSLSARDAPGDLEALLVDHGLSAIVESGATYPTAGPLAVQRLMSELLMIQAELPSHQRTFVLAPDRRWDPEPAYAADLLAATGQVPWIEPVTLPTVASSPPDETERAQLDFPAEERAKLLRRDYLAGVEALKHRLDAFAEILPAGDAQARSFDIGLLRLLSSAWRDDTVAADARLAQFSKHVETTMERVHITSEEGSFVTLTSHSGTVPVTVANELDTPVEIRVGIDSPKLEVRGNGEVTQTIPAHRQVPVDIRATAKASGVFTLTVTLSTPSGVQYGDPVNLYVRSTAYGRTALLITGAATAALLVAVAVRLVRRARRARHSRHPEPVDA